MGWRLMCLVGLSGLLGLVEPATDPLFLQNLAGGRRLPQAQAEGSRLERLASRLEQQPDAETAQPFTRVQPGLIGKDISYSSLKKTHLYLLKGIVYQDI